MGCTAKLIVQLPHGVREISVDPGQDGRLSDLLRRAELPLNTRCGQRGLCDGCLVDIVEGSLWAESGEPWETGLQQVVRACQCRLPPGGYAVVHVPARSLLAHPPQIVSSFRVDVSRAHDPLWQRLDLQENELSSDASRIDAICQAIARRRDGDLPLRPEGPLSEWARLGHEAPRLTLDQQADHWAVTPATDDPTSRHCGLAVDVGTTTVVVLLVDLDSGQILHTASALNAQTRLGDNVVTRINLCLQDKQMVPRLQHALIRRTLQPLLDEVLAGGGRTIDQIKCLTVAGNTTMLHLLAGVDPSPLGTAPFTAEFLEHRVLRGGELAILPDRRQHAAAGGQAIRPSTPPDPTVHLLPGAAAYLGADVIAGLFATGMTYRDAACLLVDIGTNGEIVLKHQDRFLGCATAAGPAFEGAGLSSGVRAAAGAISHIRLNGPRLEPEFDVIGDRSPMGICGTGYVDFLAVARARGLIGRHGRFASAVADHPRMATHARSRGFDLTTGADGHPIQITEADIASLLQAKAAIAAGIACLLRRARLAAADIDTLYLAGGFGFHMNLQNVIGCGILPGFETQQIQLVGNSSLAGAYLALADSGVLREMKCIAQRLEIIELNLDPHFESLYIDQLELPAVEMS